MNSKEAIEDVTRLLYSSAESFADSVDDVLKDEDRDPKDPILLEVKKFRREGSFQVVINKGGKNFTFDVKLTIKEKRR